MYTCTEYSIIHEGGGGRRRFETVFSTTLFSSNLYTRMLTDIVPAQQAVV